MRYIPGKRVVFFSFLLVGGFCGGYRSLLVVSGSLPLSSAASTTTELFEKITPYIIFFAVIEKGERENKNDDIASGTIYNNIIVQLMRHPVLRQ